MKIILQGEELIHWTTTILCTNSFLCLKQWKYQMQKQQRRKNGKTRENTGMAADESQKQKRGVRWSKERRQNRTLCIVNGSLSSLKNSELEPEFQKYKGRVVLGGDIVKDDPGSYAARLPRTRFFSCIVVVQSSCHWLHALTSRITRGSRITEHIVGVLAPKHSHSIAQCRTWHLTWCFRARALLPHLSWTLPSASTNPAEIYGPIWVALWLSPPCYRLWAQAACWEQGQLTEHEDLHVKPMSFHQSITASTYDSAESIATPLPESDSDDEQLRAPLASPLYLQEREASAERSQVYHSEREHLTSSSSQDPISTGKLVALFSSQNRLNQESFSDREDFPLRHQQFFFGATILSSDSLTRQMLQNLFLMGTEITCLLKRDLNHEAGVQSGIS